MIEGDIYISKKTVQVSYGWFTRPEWTEGKEYKVKEHNGSPYLVNDVGLCYFGIPEHFKQQLKNNL